MSRASTRHLQKTHLSPAAPWTNLSEPRCFTKQVYVTVLEMIVSAHKHLSVVTILATVIMLLFANTCLALTPSNAVTDPINNMSVNESLEKDDCDCEQPDQISNIPRRTNYEAALSNQEKLSIPAALFLGRDTFSIHQYSRPPPLAGTITTETPVLDWPVVLARSHL